MHGDQGLDTHVLCQSDSLLRGGVGAFKARSPLVSPDGHHPQIKRAVTAAEILENGVVSGIPAKIDPGISIADGITGPAGFRSGQTGLWTKSGPQVLR